VAFSRKLLFFTTRFGCVLSHCMARHNVQNRRKTRGYAEIDSVWFDVLLGVTSSLWAFLRLRGVGALTGMVKPHWIGHRKPTLAVVRTSRD
jgi:hypothetical protein